MCAKPQAPRWLTALFVDNGGGCASLADSAKKDDDEDENDGGMTSTTQIELMYANRTD